MIDDFQIIPLNELMTPTNISPNIQVPKKSNGNTVLYIGLAIIVIGISAYVIYKINQQNLKNEDHD